MYCDMVMGIMGNNINEVINYFPRKIVISRIWNVEKQEKTSEREKLKMTWGNTSVRQDK
jgi:hypothetical protein